jgi:hypothetical protein
VYRLDAETNCRPEHARQHQHRLSGEEALDLIVAYGPQDPAKRFDLHRTTASELLRRHGLS